MDRLCGHPVTIQDAARTSLRLVIAPGPPQAKPAALVPVCTQVQPGLCHVPGLAELQPPQLLGRKMTGRAGRRGGGKGSTGRKPTAIIQAGGEGASELSLQQ